MSLCKRRVIPSRVLILVSDASNVPWCSHQDRMVGWIELFHLLVYYCWFVDSEVWRWWEMLQELILLPWFIWISLLTPCYVGGIRLWCISPHKAAWHYSMSMTKYGKHESNGLQSIKRMRWEMVDQMNEMGL